MAFDSNAISAAILTGAYLGKSSAEPDLYMTVYADFLRRIESLGSTAQTDSDERERRRPKGAYEYKRST